MTSGRGSKNFVDVISGSPLWGTACQLSPSRSSSIEKMKSIVSQNSSLSSSSLSRSSKRCFAWARSSAFSCEIPEGMNVRALRVGNSM